LLTNDGQNLVEPSVIEIEEFKSEVRFGFKGQKNIGSNEIVYQMI